MGDTVKFGAKVIQNPNTNTTFAGNNVRSFTFNFKIYSLYKRIRYTNNN